MDEQEVVAQLEAWAVQQGGEVVVFDGSAGGIDGAMQVFPCADVVLGVHGAGLANILFCNPQAALVEIALPEPEVGGAITQSIGSPSSVTCVHVCVWLPPRLAVRGV